MLGLCVRRRQYHASQYVAACQMVAEGETVVLWVRDAMWERREKVPLQVSVRWGGRVW